MIYGKPLKGGYLSDMLIYAAQRNNADEWWFRQSTATNALTTKTAEIRLQMQ